jgi:hypothetical protein
MNKIIVFVFLFILIICSRCETEIRQQETQDYPYKSYSLVTKTQRDSLSKEFPDLNIDWIIDKAYRIKKGCLTQFTTLEIIRGIRMGKISLSWGYRGGCLEETVKISNEYLISQKEF